MARHLYHLAAWWHLLSLDAPTVAALWSWFFARAMHLHLSFVQTLLLGTATWLLYVADRILDGLRSGSARSLRERHHFHARHRLRFLAGIAVFSVLLTWLACTRMLPAALHADLFLALFALAYMVSVHLGGRLPKELAVAAIFAAATAIPAWSRLPQYAEKDRLAPAVLLFALLCYVNCVGIDKWEGGGANPHASTRWAGLHLRPIVTIIALFAAIAAMLAPSRGLLAVYLATLASSGLLLLLDIRSARLPGLKLRIAADAALLTPLAFLPLAR